jgi:hypothetical protein
MPDNQIIKKDEKHKFTPLEKRFVKIYLLLTVFCGFWLISAKASSTQTGVSGIFLLALKLVFCLICSSVCPLSASSACLNSEEAPLTMMLNFCCFCSGVSLNQLLRVDLTFRIKR